ncbi:MAG: SAM-dependent methyltransferase [Verrucomicrobia bacterium]|nr:SAM-dependent methyltransferase [Verrucomicrobiota bacterium]
MNDLAEILRREIAAAGVLPFDRFMGLALFHPTLGYYERPDAATIGRQGDYFTSVSVGSLFGQLLAFQFADWLAALPGGPVQLVEAGAHDGRLAADVLGWLQLRRTVLFERLEYWIVEPSARRRGWQAGALEQFTGKIRWFAGWERVPATGVQGIIFANELLDAFPVRRFGWDARAKSWFEWGVALDGDRFVWARIRGAGNGPLQNPSSTLDPPSSSLWTVLPEGFTIETCPAAEAWWGQAARALREGKLLTLDYGLTTEQFFFPERSRGTLRAYRRHHATDDALADPGEQDLTAHINFSALQAVGAAAGLHTAPLASQAQFLTRIAARTWQPRSDFEDWTPLRIRQFQTLTHPEHLGERFRVLIQSRDD